MKYFTIFLLLLVANFAAAQKNNKTNKTNKTSTAKAEEPRSTLRFSLGAPAKLKAAKGFREIYENLSPKITAIYIDKYGNKRGTYSYYPRLDTAKYMWIWDELPVGIMALEVEHIAFKPIRDTLLMNEREEVWERTLEVDSMLYTYNNREQYTYLRGSLNFSQTFIVKFDGGDMVENYEKILELIPDAVRVQKTRYDNAFYITIPIADARTVDDLIAEKKFGRTRAFEGYYIGPMITKYIELLQNEPNVAWANPTFYNDPREAEMFDPKKTPKSDYLIKKQILQLTDK